MPSDVKARYPNDKTGQINTVLGKNPLLFDRYLSDAIEVDVDCLCDGKDAFIAGIMEHIEEAGIHSGDSRLLAAAALARRRDDRRAGAPDQGDGAGARRRRPDERAVRHQGRRHLRARSEPARLAHGALRRQGHRHRRSPRSPPASWPARSSAELRPEIRSASSTHVGVKEAVFPFARFPGVDVLLGPEMRSTGEVIGLDRSFDIAFAKSQLGAGSKVPRQGHRLRLGARRGQAASYCGNGSHAGPHKSSSWRSRGSSLNR
jgi:carbamoyl-phosphate synthase large subunit